MIGHSFAGRGKRLVVVAAALALGAGAVACGSDSGSSSSSSSGSSGGGDAFKVGLITKTETNPFFVKMKEGADAKAKEVGGELQSFAGKKDGDNESQVAAVESYRDQPVLREDEGGRRRRRRRSSAPSCSPSPARRTATTRARSRRSRA